MVSDTHKNIDNLRKALLQAREADYLFCLGDHFSDIQQVKDLWPKNVSFVKGNCDFGYAPLTAVERVAGQKLLLTHGHEYGVKLSLTRIALLAEEREADGLLFGHTHQPLIEYASGGRLLFNPGSLSSANPTYGWLEVSSAGIFPSIRSLR